MTDLRIKCKNITEKKAALCLLFAHGYSYPDADNMTDMLKTQSRYINDIKYSSILLLWCSSDEEYYIDMAPEDYIMKEDSETHKFSELTSIVDFLSYTGDTIKVKISEDYDAIVTKEYIKVGCQTIKFEDFDKLVSAVKKIRK